MNAARIHTARTDIVQLRLIGSEPTWRIDEQTKRIGREGIARARAALDARGTSTEQARSPVRIERAA